MPYFTAVIVLRLVPSIFYLCNRILNRGHHNRVLMEISLSLNINLARITQKHLLIFFILNKIYINTYIEPICIHTLHTVFLYQNQPEWHTWTTVPNACFEVRQCGSAGARIPPHRITFWTEKDFRNDRIHRCASLHGILQRISGYLALKTSWISKSSLYKYSSLCILPIFCIVNPS